MPCDEMTVVAGAGGALRAAGGCPVCREAVSGGRQESALDDAPRVGALVVTNEAAIEAAARLLVEARSAFIYGLARSSDAAARAASSIAALIGGSLDIEGSERLQPDLDALQAYGLPTATFGEIRNRADLILFWRCDPRATHPWLFAKPAGTPLEKPAGRIAILVPPAASRSAPRPTATAAGDLVLEVASSGDLDAILALRALLLGKRPDRPVAGGAPVAALSEAASRLARARYAAIVWRSDDLAFPGGTAVAAALALLARDLNRVTRAAARPLGEGGNVAGAMAALLGCAGVPRAAGFASGRARFAPGEFDARRMIAGGGADLLLLIGARSIPAPAEFRAAAAPRSAAKAIVVGPRLPDGLPGADVVIPTAVPGISSGGVARRADGIPVRLRAHFPSPRPVEEEVLRALAGFLAPERRQVHG